MAEVIVMHVGRYKGTPIDQLPTSYLRWMLGQEFPKEILEIAKRKVDQSPHSNEYISISRHALDRFSVRFIRIWQDHMMKKHGERDGIATFLSKLAEEAWLKGVDVSKNRHPDDGTIRLYKGIQFVYGQNKQFPDYKELITVMD